MSSHASHTGAAGAALLTRDAFREGVFARDSYRCVHCGATGVKLDAHHLIERRLWPDGGYYLANGVSLCENCHLLAERTLLEVDRLRREADITEVLLPPHLDPDGRYDKWGNPVLPSGQRLRGELFFEESVQKALSAPGILDLFSPYVKYPRTWHVPWSPGATADDRTLASMSHFAGREVVVTEKTDGENTTLNSDGYVHARSIDGRHHPSRNWVKALAARVAHELPEGWRLCGENMYARHSLGYTDLPGFLLLFSVWDERNRCLSWDDTVAYADMLSIPTVPVIYRGVYDEAAIRAAHTGVSAFGGGEAEGYVIRLAGRFEYREFPRAVAKVVRASHVQTSGHWMSQAVVPNELADAGSCEPDTGD